MRPDAVRRAAEDVRSSLVAETGIFQKGSDDRGVAIDRQRIPELVTTQTIVCENLGDLPGLIHQLDGMIFHLAFARHAGRQESRSGRRMEAEPRVGCAVGSRCRNRNGNGVGARADHGRDGVLGGMIPSSVLIEVEPSVKIRIADPRQVVDFDLDLDMGVPGPERIDEEDTVFIVDHRVVASRIGIGFAVALGIDGRPQAEATNHRVASTVVRCYDRISIRRITIIEGGFQIV